MGTKKFELPSVVGVNVDNCVNCHSCISACPVKFCNDGSQDFVGVNANMCIACGKCIAACTHEARYYIDDFEAMLESLKKGEKIVAIVAPSVAASFPDEYLNLNGWLKSIGIEAIFDVSFGAELTSRSYKDFIEKEKPEIVIAQPCPALVTYIQLYQPELLPHLAPVDSPVLHTIKMIKRFYPKYADHQIAFISPCNAKKREFALTGYGEYNVAYKSIAKHLSSNGQKLNEFPATDFDNPPAERGVLFCQPGGLLQTMERSIPEARQKTRVIEGVPKVYEYLQKLPENIDNKRAPFLIDCLSCDYGCTAGPFTLVQGQSIDEMEYWTHKRKQEMIQRFKDKHESSEAGIQHIEKTISEYWEEGLYKREYQNLWQNIELKYPNENEIQHIFNKMHKYKKEDEFNCTSCGYGNCRQMAIAIFNNLNKAENCHFYLHSETEISHKEILKGKEHFATIISTSAEGFLQIDNEMLITDANEAFKEMVKRNDVIGRSYLEFVAEESIETVLAQAESRAKGQKSAYEINMLQSEGDKISCLINAAPIFDENGQKIGAFAFITDITKLKNTEEELKLANETLEQKVTERTAELNNTIEELQTISDKLQENNTELEKLSLVASKTDNAILILDAHGNVEWGNDAFETIHGITVSELVRSKGRNIRDFSTNGDIEQALEFCFETKETISYESSCIFPSSKDRIWLHTSLTPILNNEGELVKLITIDTDITIIKEAEEEIAQQNEELKQLSEELLAQSQALAEANEAIKESEQQLFNIIEFLPDPTFVINQEKKVIAWNHAMAELTKVKAHTMIGKGDYEYSMPFYGECRPTLIDLVFHPINEINEKYKQVTFHNNVLTAESFVPMIGNQGAYLLGTASSLLDAEGNIIGAIEIIKDISERRKAEIEIKNANNELATRNTEVELQKQDLIDKNQVLQMQKLEIAAHRDKIEKQRKNLTDSITYAQRIQAALLPTEQYINEVLPQNAIIYIPRDIVSGDFYYLRQNASKTYIAVADCTGHGVPGALMSMLGYAFLNEIINDIKQETSTAEILNQLRNKLIKALKQKGEAGEAHNGMDISILAITHQTRTYQYSGANNPLYIIKSQKKQAFESEILIAQTLVSQDIKNQAKLRLTTDNNRTLIEVKGDKMPIGSQGNNETSFNSWEAKIDEGDTLFMISDGYASQFGGPRGRKYQSKNLRKFLLSIQDEPMQEQKKIIMQNLSDWQGKKTQVDDITIFGIRF